MLCEICHGAVLTVRQEREPMELFERDSSGGLRRRVVRCCEVCYQRAIEAGAQVRADKEKKP